ncbi:DUF2946 family protein [Bradyrhizobium jicamae]|uniref:DUF2946 family protein n=1 Tax=Bradyrhizobium jicamae TaxID=280332 RepID=UPI001BA7DEC1|nr:DUF2946 family protein [Bradyrhizobium jicamae]MBR0757268.1 DUF2946 family protein [Bradyrhizobium jicamae]
MKWFRKHIRTGSRLALFALAIQLVLSFGHFHPLAAAHAAVVKSGLTQVNFADIGTSATPDLAIEVSKKPSPANHDNDKRHGDICAICAVMSLAGHALFAPPPLLLLPEVTELLLRTTDAEFLHLKSAPSAFRSRAPPHS